MRKDDDVGHQRCFRGRCEAWQARVTVLRAELENWIGPIREESVLERTGNRLLERAGIDGWKTEHAILWSLNNRFDVAVSKKQVAIERDSNRWHARGRAFNSDREGDAEALVHDWCVLRFTWADAHHRPTYVIDTVRAVLVLARPAGVCYPGFHPTCASNRTLGGAERSRSCDWLQLIGGTGCGGRHSVSAGAKGNLTDRYGYRCRWMGALR